MQRLVVIALLLVCACQSGKAPPAARDATYAKDVERICNAEALSGALNEDPNGRAQLVAIWLANNLVTQSARDLMSRQARLAPAEKAALLHAEAREVGLSGCPTADTWVPKGP